MNRRKLRRSSPLPLPDSRPGNRRDLAGRAHRGGGSLSIFGAETKITLGFHHAHGPSLPRQACAASHRNHSVSARKLDGRQDVVETWPEGVHA